MIQLLNQRYTHNLRGLKESRNGSSMRIGTRGCHKGICRFQGSNLDLEKQKSLEKLFFRRRTFNF